MGGGGGLGKGVRRTIIRYGKGLINDEGSYSLTSYLCYITSQDKLNYFSDSFPQTTYSGYR